MPDTSLPSSTTEDAAADVEVLATRLMGWRACRSGMYWANDAGEYVTLREDQPPEECPGRAGWNPFEFAGDDLQVLERVREAWGPTKPFADWPNCHMWGAFERALPASVNYTAGAFARAALVVLREMEEG